MTESKNLAAGTYEVLRNRLRDAAKDLRERLAKLNDSRAEVFGNIETTLIATERVNIVYLGTSFRWGINFSLDTTFSSD